MPKILDWLRPRSATLPELKEQREHAITAHQATQAATVAAQDAFDADGSPSAEKALHAARDAERSAFEHLGRSERLLAAAEMAEKARDHEAKEARIREIDAELADRTLERKLEAATVEAFVACIDRLLAQREHNVACAALRREQTVLGMALGHDRRIDVEDVEPALYRVAEELDELALGNAGPRGDWLRKLSARIAPGHVNTTRAHGRKNQ